MHVMMVCGDEYLSTLLNAPLPPQIGGRPLLIYDMDPATREWFSEGWRATEQDTSPISIDFDSAALPDILHSRQHDWNGCSAEGIGHILRFRPHQSPTTPTNSRVRSQHRPSMGCMQTAGRTGIACVMQRRVCISIHALLW